MIEKIFPILGFMTHVYTIFLILVKKRKKTPFPTFLCEYHPRGTIVSHSQTTDV